MKPADQTGEGATGTCWRACLASILEMPFADVPELLAHDLANQYTATQTWLRGRGLSVVGWDWKHGLWPPYGYLILSGLSPRGPQTGHAVVVHVGDDRIVRLAHDPHPSRLGVGGPAGTGEPKDHRRLYAITLIDPSRAYESWRRSPSSGPLLLLPPCP